MTIKEAFAYIEENTQFDRGMLTFSIVGVDPEQWAKHGLLSVLNTAVSEDSNE